MRHRITVVELAIQPEEFFPIVQNGAKDTKFSFYEENGNRTIYSKNMRGARAWLAVESQEENARLEAWFSGTNTGPEFEGNFWVGWKMPLPEGFAIGFALLMLWQMLKMKNEWKLA